jgi:single-stranded-DNA-specific exonuclease
MEYLHGRISTMQRRFTHATEPKEGTHALHGYSPLLTRLLVNRGITTAEAAYAYLSPSYESDMHDPFLMHDMEKAVVRLFEAVEAKEKIVVYADYDCDGIPGAVILHDLLKKIGHGNFSVYIPDRHDEGYGLHREAVDRFIQDEVSLIITIDLGTSDVDSVTHALANGIDVVVTDHHVPHEHLPPAFALVNPKLGAYPEPMLCGSGVVFKFVQAFIQKYGEYFDGTRPSGKPALTAGWEKWLLDMAGLATLSDMVPLTGENRVLAHFGLQVFRKSPRPGVTSLLRKLKIDQRYLVEDDLTFMLTPRINAASRMDSPMRAFELLSERDGVRAGALADHLSTINDERKRIVSEIMNGVLDDLKARELGPVIVVGHSSWRVGVLGIVAGKIMEEFDRPVFVWGGEGVSEHGKVRLMKGSCRSNGAVNVVSLMTARKELFVSFGGHELAGGFSVSEETAGMLEDKLISVFADHSQDAGDMGSKMIDAELSLSDVSDTTVKMLARMAPFGLGNPKPHFFFRNVTLASVRLFGKEKNHLEIIFRDSHTERTGIAFFAGFETFSKPAVYGSVVNLVATVEQSFFAGRTTIRLRIVDIQ